MTIPKRIVFINQATGYLTIDIINAFAQSSFFSEVALIAGSIRVQDIQLEKNVKWSKITRYNRGTPVKKLLSWVTGTMQIGWLLLTRYRKYEVFYITVPPFAYLLSWVLPNRFSLLVYDVYPDALTIYHIGKRNVISRCWAFLNRRLFKKAYRLMTIGEGMRQLMQQYNSTSREINVIPNWSGLTNLKIVERKSNRFLSDQGLTDKFVVMYSGNIGVTHNVEVLIDVAEQLQKEPDLFFLIVGRGNRLANIERIVNDKKLSNVRVLPFQPDDQLSETLAAADLAVVLLDDRTANISIPSKIYNLQAVGVPILGIGEETSELSLHLKKFDNGRSYSPENIQGISGFIKDFKRNQPLQETFRRNSKAASANFTRHNAGQYLELYTT